MATCGFSGGSDYLEYMMAFHGDFNACGTEPDRSLELEMIDLDTLDEAERVRLAKVLGLRSPDELKKYF